MKDEEKKAIEDSIEKKYREVTDFYKKLTKEECFYILNDKNKYSSEVKSFALLNLINLIQKQQEEIEEQDKTIDRLTEEQQEREKYTHSLEAQLEKKDKQIDLMAEEICFKEPLKYTTAQEVKVYFKKKAEENKNDNI